MSSLLAAQMAEFDSEVFIISSSDVIYVQDFVVEQLVKHARPKTYTTAEVMNIAIDPEMYTDYDEDSLLELWDGVEGNMRGGPFYTGTRKYGKSRYQFLWAVMSEDLIKMVKKDGAGAFCDTLGNLSMKELGFEDQFLDDLKGIHQSHYRGRRRPKDLQPCPLFDTCRLREKCVVRPDFKILYRDNIITATGGL